MCFRMSLGTEMFVKRHFVRIRVSVNVSGVDGRQQD